MTMNRRRFLRYAGVTAALWAVAGPERSVGQSLPEKLNVAVFAHMSGAGGTIGLETRDAVMLAAETINQLGGIAGKTKLNVLIEDTRSSAAEAVNAANRLVNRSDISYVIGPWRDDEMLASQPIFAAAGIPQFAFGYATEFTDDHSKAPLSLRLAMQARIEMPPLAKYAVVVQKHKKLFALASNTNHGRSLIPVFEATLRQLGGSFVRPAQFYAGGTTDFSTLVTQARASGAEGLLALSESGPELVAIAKEYKLQGLTPAKMGFYSHSVIGGGTFVRNVAASGDADGFIFTYDYDDGTDPRQFPPTSLLAQVVAMNQAFFQKFGRPAARNHAFGWAAVQLIKQAIEGLIAEKGTAAVAKLHPVNELPKETISYILAGRIFQLTLGDHGFLGCGQADIRAGVATYRSSGRLLLVDRNWGNDVVTGICG